LEEQAKAIRDEQEVVDHAKQIELAEAEAEFKAAAAEVAEEGSELYQPANAAAVAAAAPEPWEEQPEPEQVQPPEPEPAAAAAAAAVGEEAPPGETETVSYDTVAGMQEVKL
jgi:hypothetical protein